MQKFFYKVADLLFSVSIPDGFDPEILLPSCRPFVAECSENDNNSAFSVEAVPSLERPSDAVLYTTETNDMGRTEVYVSAQAYYFSIAFNGSEARLLTDSDFTCAKVALDWGSKYCGVLLNSVLRMVFAQSVLAHQGISMHASCVAVDGKAYLFMGKSGTGKSTHSRQWLKSFEGSYLLNDDNPVVRLIDGTKAIVYGTPWSGKTACYRNESLPVGGIARLSQAPHNKFVAKTDVAAFVEIYPGCSVLRNDSRLDGLLCDTLSELVTLVPVGHLECLPDPESALECRSGFSK